MTDAPPAARRPLKTRSRAWAIRLAGWLAARGASPNAISLLSILFAAVAGGAFLAQGYLGAVGPDAPGDAAAGGARAGLLVLAAAGVQLRLLCNLLDGMVAVEGGRKGKTGELYNEAPDRLADVLILVGAGYGLAAMGFPWGGELGFVAALLAVLTAYVRLLGGSVGLAQDFVGPMAKPHRMATLTVAALLSTIEGLLPWRAGWLLAAALLAIVAGSAVTTGRRLARIARAMESR